MANFLYPRTVQITRPNAAPSAGDGGYLGLQRADETVVATSAVIASGIPASIQSEGRGSGGNGIAGVPSDAGRTVWRILIPRNALPNGTIAVRDVVTDELGLRYQVVADYWDSLGYAVKAEQLVA